MKIFRLSLFNIKKNKKEVIAIIFLTFITVFLMGGVVTGATKMNTAFDESFDRTGCVTNMIVITGEKYRDEYLGLLTDDPNVSDVKKNRMLDGMTGTGVVRDKNGETIAYNMYLCTEKTERQIEDFVKTESMSESEIAALKHPIWLPTPFSVTLKYNIGDTFTLVSAGRDYPFTVAGFYEAGLLSSSGHGYKLIVSDEDYELLSYNYNERVCLSFNASDKWDRSQYYEKCTEATGENISSYCFAYYKEGEKLIEISFLSIFIVLSSFLSIVTLVAATFLIRRKITNDIEDQMQQIGVLEALGYRLGEISLSYLYEYVFSGGSGSLLGCIASILFTPVMNSIVGTMMGRRYHGMTTVFGDIVIAIIVTMIITGFALLKAGAVKKFPPVIAFRKGIQTHHFGKNILPLEKHSGNINIKLALKDFFINYRSGIGTGICIIIAGAALVFAVQMLDFFKTGVNGLVSLMGCDIVETQIELMNGVDAKDFADEISQLDGVRKVLLNYGYPYIKVKNSAEDGTAIVFEDFNDSENIFTTEGRYPEHDNEIMISLKRAKLEGYRLGDSITVYNDSIEKTYVICGIVNSMMNSGYNLYLTKEGYLRLNPNARPGSVEVYLDKDYDRKKFEDTLGEMYGSSARDSQATSESGGDLESMIRKVADEKMAILISEYGVTDVDYAIYIGDEVITGDSRKFVIKNISSLQDLKKSQMEPIATQIKGYSVGALIFIAIVVGVILYILTVSNIRRQRQALGIMKSMGYSSKDLMIQMSVKFMPITVTAAVFASILAIFLTKAFWLYGLGIVMGYSIFLIIVVDILLIIYCFFITYISSRRIKKISVTELMTE